jgi:outer membrane protein assembly factor BamB
MPGGNVISPACYWLQDGKCLSRSVGDGSPRTNRGEEIGVLKDDYLIFGGRLRYSGIGNEVNPGVLTIAKIDSGGVGKAMNVAFGKIPPAWSADRLVMANGPWSVPMCVDTAELVDYLEKVTPKELRQQSGYASTLKKNWTAQALEGSDAVAFVIAKNTIITVVETQRPRSLSSSWILAGLDPDTGKVLWKQQLPSAALPGGILVDRHGRTIVVHEDGTVSCFGG